MAGKPIGKAAMTATERQRRWRAGVRYETLREEWKELRPKRSIQRTHSKTARGLDAYFTCPEAIQSLILLEGDRIPQRIWEPAAGGGAIVTALRDTGRFVVASDIFDYKLLPGCAIYDYLTAPRPPGIEGIVTNPPYGLALRFLAKALAEVPYLALLVRTNFLMDGSRRARFLIEHPPTRELRSVSRLPMMHRLGWKGKKASSDTPYCWVVWERDAPRELPQLFDWKELLGGGRRVGQAVEP